MEATTDALKAAWTPPARPDWVARVNEEGLYLDLRGVVPLDAESLIRTAIGNTGLSDFGDDDWREPFHVLVRALDDEAKLTLIGRILSRSDLLMFLEGRLRVEEMYRLHPEIEDEQVESPIWILGQGRSGTTMLQYLLSLDPANITPRFRDGMFPCGLNGMDDDALKQLADARVTMWNRVTPELVAMHDFAGEAPTETGHLECLSFRNPPWLSLLGLTPTYTAYMGTQDFTPAYAYLKRILKLLQWREPGRRWVLKSPPAINFLPPILSVFPDVRFVWAHRDPLRALASAVSIIGTLGWLRSDQVHSKGTYDEITDLNTVAHTLTRPIEWIESGLVPSGQLFNVQYGDLVNDPLGSVGKIYDFYDIPYSERARSEIQAYLDAHPRSERPAHRYSSGDAVQIARERIILGKYQSYFSVPDEN
jgi:hypothetical protein